MEGCRSTASCFRIGLKYHERGDRDFFVRIQFAGMVNRNLYRHDAGRSGLYLTVKYIKYQIISFALHANYFKVNPLIC